MADLLALYESRLRRSRRFSDAERTIGAVSTDSRTGALEFYRKAGMSVDQGYTRLVKVGL
jgi:hypothetical protein